MQQTGMPCSVQGPTRAAMHSVGRFNFDVFCGGEKVGH